MSMWKMAWPRVSDKYTIKLRKILSSIKILSWRMGKEIWEYKNVHTHTHTSRTAQIIWTSCSNRKKKSAKNRSLFIFLSFSGNAKKSKKDPTTVFSCARPAATTLTGHCCLNNSNRIQRPIRNNTTLYEEGETNLIHLKWNTYFSRQSPNRWRRSK